MKYSAEIITNLNYNKYIPLFIPETKDNFGSRAKYTIIDKDDNICFFVQAEDSVALRAVLNSITKMLTIFEKTHKIISETKNE